MTNEFHWNIITRFGIGVTDEAWLSHRLKLFEAITLPSISNQRGIRADWHIFVGPSPLDWVVSTLQKITESVSNIKINIVREPMLSGAIHAAVSQSSPYRIVALIDDDDAWHLNTYERVSSICRNHISQSSNTNLGLTFPTGFEWTINDLVDVDEFAKRGALITRSAGVRSYTRSFLGMSCFVLEKHDSDFRGWGAIHHTKGDCLIQHGYTRFEIEDPTPMWLYTRHHQADSALQKSGGKEALDLSLEQLGADFGINVKLIKALQAAASDYAYSVKRSHGQTDKSKLTFKASEIGLAIVPQENSILRSVNGTWYFGFTTQDYPTETGTPLKLVVVDNNTRRSIIQHEALPDENFPLIVPENYIDGEWSFKYQVKINGRWEDASKYRGLLKSK